MDHTHHQSMSAQARCEFCGMVAVGSYCDNHGVDHAYCEHHRSADGGEVPNDNPPAGGQMTNKNDKKTSNDQVHREHTNHSSGDFNKHAGHSVNMFRDRFWVSLIVTLPTVLFSSMFQELLGFQLSFPGSAWLPFIGGTFLMVYGGTVFLRSALGELRAKLPGMMTLISLAIVAAYTWSVVAMFLAGTSDFFWELATLITVMLLGHWIEMKSVADASGALRELANLLPDKAERLIGVDQDQTETIHLSEVKVGDRLLIRPGTKIPVDGEVIEGSSSVNESMITGESKPLEKIVGSQLIAGTVNAQGVLTIKTTKVGADTALSGIMRLVAEAQASRSRAQVVADKAAFALTIIALLVGLISFFGWLAASQSLTFAFERLVTVLVIACPHALGLAVPLVTAISTSLAAKNGILVRKRIALETARSVQIVLFDKTGTLTSGQFGVDTFMAVAGRKPADILALAAAVESASEHPLAQAMVMKAREEQVTLSKAADIQALPGQGISGMVDGRPVMVGGPQILQAKKLTVPSDLEPLTNEAAEKGQTIVYVIADGIIVGAITLADQIRPESREAITTLHQLGLKIAMITGDSKDVAAAVAKELAIDTVFAQVSPEEKIAKVKELQKQDLRVAMVGDGVNDAAALTQADVGIAIGAGTDVAIESAGIILMRNDPRDIVKIVALARATYRKTIQNLIWATGYNVLAIPLAAGALAGQGLLLAPAVGAVLMSLSTVIVAFNAQLLRRSQL